MSETNQPFVLAHLSDVHLPVPWARLLSSRLDGWCLTPKQALGLANWVLRRHRVHRREAVDAIVAAVRAYEPDHWAVTGDLVNMTLGGELAAAVDWLEELAPVDQVSVVLGNHDAYMTVGRAAARKAYARWTDSNGSGLGSGGAKASAPAGAYVKVCGAVALIGLNSGVVTPAFNAWGELCDAQRGWLAEQLRTTQRQGLWRVVMVHHPPLPGQAPARCGLADAPAFRDVMANEGAELVLHGHNHKRMLETTPGPLGPVPVVGVPSVSHAAGHADRLARAHLFRFFGRPAENGPIEMQAIGLPPRGGAPVEIETMTLTNARVAAA